jgi:TrmH family RNA methyltransferase
MIHVILVEPEHPGNIGACARAMKNFGFRSLILIEPKSGITEEARKRAKHAQDILSKARIEQYVFLDSLDLLIGTTAKVGTDYNIPRAAISPKELGKTLSKKQNIGLIFGREGTGLTNEEIARCDIVVSIPASAKYPTLNISHALAIILYELSSQKIKDIPLAGRKEKDLLASYAEKSTKTLDLGAKRTTISKVWKRVIGKSMLTKREAFSLMGYFRKIK